MKVFYNPENKKVYLVPNHYGRSLKYIKETLEWAKINGLTIPEDEGITFEVLASHRYKRHLSIEFKSATKPTCDFVDLKANSDMYGDLTY